MSNAMRINENETTKIPAEILKQAGIKAGDEIIFTYDETTKQINVMKKPEDFAKALRGLGKELWSHVDIETYIAEERNSWE